jgi:PKD repeat protein
LHELRQPPADLDRARHPSPCSVVYTGSGYPAAYRNALFFTDWARRCIWVMPPDANGLPDPTRIATFAANLSGGSVNLERGPGGDLFYVDYDGGRVRRITYFGGNQPPLVDLKASTDSGPSPLLVQFDASASIDPEGGALRFAWDLDDDGQFTDSTAAVPSWTFTTPGPHRVRVRVSDPQANSSTGSITIYADNLPPTARILTPSPSLTWRVGQPITFSGEANDPDQGPLPPSTFRWTLVINHCPSNCHLHTVQTWAGFAAGSFSAPDHEYPSYLTLTLTVTDDAGLTATASVDLQPQTVPITVDTVPSGLTIALGAQAATTPFTRTVIVGSANTITAASPQQSGGGSLGFKSWSDGGQATHVLTAPATRLTVVATYRPIAELRLTFAAPSRAVLSGRVATTVTVANAGPTTATNVQIVQNIPDGVVPLMPLPAGCAAANAILTCTVAQISVGGNTSVALVFRAMKAGAFTLAAGALANEADTNATDSSASTVLNVRPSGDFNNDGKDDLFWLNSTTGSAFWTFLNGPTIIGGDALTPDRGAGWRLVGIGDFNGDGFADLFWRNQTTGANEIWLMKDTARTSTVVIASAPDVNWYIAATADFNGDGWPDLLWRHRTSGLVMIAPMVGTTPGSLIALPTVTDPTWELIGVPDLNGDGAPDLVWRRTTDGLMYGWLMNGTTPTIIVQLGSMGANWRASSFADVNGDGKPDIIFREQTGGYDAAVYMNGLTATGGAFLPTVTDLNWTIAAPR